VQSTTGSFMAEMERAAAAGDRAAPPAWSTPPADTAAEPLAASEPLAATIPSERSSGLMEEAVELPGTMQHPDEAADLTDDVPAPGAPNPSP
jgi:hypothetical protein